MARLYAAWALAAAALGWRPCLAVKLPKLGRQRQQQRRPLPEAPPWAAFGPPPFPTPLSCSCLVWKAQYLLQNVRCGRGAELYTYTGGANKQQALPAFMRVQDETFCNDRPGKPNSAFFPKQEHAFCIRQSQSDPAGQDSGSWCYVSGHCDLPSARPVANSTLKAKICQPGLDATLGDIQPVMVFQMALKYEVSPRLMAQMAYRPAGVEWDKYAQLAKLRQSRSWNGTQWFADQNGALKVAWQDQLWHVYAEEGKMPLCVEGCGQ